MERKVGEYYKQLDVGYNYMLDRVKIDFSGSSNFKGNLDPELHEKKRLEGVRKQIFEATTREVEEELHGIFKNVNEMWSLIEILDITVAASLRTLTLSMDNDLASIARRHGMAITDYKRRNLGRIGYFPSKEKRIKLFLIRFGMRQAFGNKAYAFTRKVAEPKSADPFELPWVLKAFLVMQGNKQ
ncbi:hypothetical protein BC829DRAFT_416214 [Chytridium lagenaria]|nr:hypothetical protein BC829DRAFT_416214 [Chytridium lagenaria]